MHHLVRFYSSLEYKVDHTALYLFVLICPGAQDSKENAIEWP